MSFPPGAVVVDNCCNCSAGSPNCALVSAQGLEPFPGWPQCPSWGQATFGPTGFPCWLNAFIYPIANTLTTSDGLLGVLWSGDARCHTRYLTFALLATCSQSDSAPGGTNFSYSLNWTQTVDADTGTIISESMTETLTGTRYVNYSSTMSYSVNPTTGAVTASPSGTTPGSFVLHGYGEWPGLNDIAGFIAGGGSGTASLSTTADSLEYDCTYVEDNAYGTGPGTQSGTGQIKINLTNAITLEGQVAAAESLRDRFNLGALSTVYNWSNGTSGPLAWGNMGQAQYVLTPGSPKVIALSIVGAATNVVSIDVSGVCGSSYSFGGGGNIVACKIRGRDDQTGGTSCYFSQEESVPAPSSEPPYNSTCTTPQDNGTYPVFPNGTVNCVYVAAADLQERTFAFTYGQATLYLHGCIPVPGGTCC